MNKLQLITELQNMGPALLTNRMRVANNVMEYPDIFPQLLKIMFDVKNKLSIKAAWTVEIICGNSLETLTPNLDEFTNQLKNIEFGSAVRPASKICGFLANAYQSKNKNLIKEVLTQDQMERIIEAGFDWLISDHKVAVKAYSMEFLYIFGKNTDWVHNELKLILERNLAYESCGYIARGRKIIHWINKYSLA